MRLALLVFLLLPLPVYAMPPALFVAIGFAVATAEILSIAVTVASIALTIGTTVFGVVQQRAAAKKAKRNAARAREDFLNSLQERTVTRIATDAPHRYVYGRARVGSNIVAMLTSGANDEYRHLVCVHANHECDAIEEIYIDGKALGPLDMDGYVTTGDFFLSTTTENVTHVSATSPFTLAHTPSGAIKVIAYGWPMAGTTRLPYGNVSADVSYTRVGNTITVAGAPVTPNYATSIQVTEYRVTYQYQIGNSQVRVFQHRGVAGDPVDSSLLAECPGKWAATATLAGLCYTVIRLDLRQAAFQGGLPSIEVLLRGKKLYDLRTGLTSWSQNNALAIYDYLTSPMCGVDATDLPAAYFITAANVCDETQTFGARYTLNGTVTSAEDQAHILEGMADSMAGTIVSTTWEVIAGKYVAPIASLSQDDIVGSLAITPGISGADIINGVRGQNITAENLYVATDYVPYQNATYLAADGKDKYADNSYPFTDSKQRAWNLARIYVEDMRNGFTIKADFSHKAWDRRIGDRITFTSAFVGQTAKVYRITDKKYSPDSSVELVLKEDAASIWDFADTVNIDDTPNSNLPDPFVVLKLTFLTLDSGTDSLLIQQDGTIVSRIKVTWNETTQATFTSGIIEIEWKKDSDIVWRKTTATGSDTGLYLSPVEDLAWYSVRARAVNPYINAKSDWTYADLHQVIGKSAPPGDIADLSIDGYTLSWTPIADLDRDGYIFRYHIGENIDWGTAVALHTESIKSSPYTPEYLPYGSLTIMGKAVDTTGNESVNVATIFTDLGDAPVANVVEEYHFEPTFTGTVTNGLILSGAVVANAADSFYADNAQSFYGVSGSFYKPAAGYGKVVYESGPMSVSGALIGSKITIALDSLGVDSKIEYLVSGEGSFYGPDSSTFYGDDGAGFFVPGPEAFEGLELVGFDATNPNSFFAVDVANFNPANPDSFLAVDLSAFVSGVSTGASFGSFYDATSGGTTWQQWPGRVTARNGDYQFRVTIGSGATRGKINSLVITIDAPDMAESIANLAISASGTTIPYLKSFHSIKVVNATLQTNGSGATTIEVDKTNALRPVIKAFNSSHTSVSGATADVFLQGY